MDCAVCAEHRGPRQSEDPAMHRGPRQSEDHAVHRGPRQVYAAVWLNADFKFDIMQTFKGLFIDFKKTKYIY